MIGGCDIRPAEPPPRPEAAFPMSAGLLKRVGWLGDVPAGKWLVRCGQEKRDAVDVARVTEGGVDAPRASVWRRRHTAGWRVRVCKQPFHSNSRWEQRERGGTSGIRHEHKCRVDDRLWSRLSVRSGGTRDDESCDHRRRGRKWGAAQGSSSVVHGGGRPNGSRFSCGRNARGCKEPERQTKRLASEATQLLSNGERPPASTAC